MLGLGLGHGGADAVGQEVLLLLPSVVQALNGEVGEGGVEALVDFWIRALSSSCSIGHF